VNTLALPWRRVLVGSWIMIAVLSVATLTLYVDNKRTRDCIGVYTRADQENTTARAVIADRERQVFLGTLQAIVDPKGTPITRQNAINAYIDEVLRNNQLRQQNPILPVPTECD
jgi:hypothetical protein